MPDSGYKIEEQLRINKMYFFTIAYHKKKYIFHGDSHNFWEIMYVLSGSVRVSGHDRVYDLSEGDIIFHAPHEMHKYYTTSPNTKYLVYAHDLEGELADFFRRKVFTLSEEQKNIISSLLHYINTKAEESSPTDSETAFYAEADKVQNYDFILSNPAYGHGLILYLYQLMMSLAFDGTRAEPSSSYEVKLFSAAVKFMTNNLSATKTVDEIAKHINISVSGLKRIFEKCAGMGVHKYFLMLKLNAATSLLEEGHSVSHVASLLGFSTQSHFSRTYKREFNYSPSEVKQKKQGT